MELELPNHGRTSSQLTMVMPVASIAADAVGKSKQIVAPVASHVDGAQVLPYGVVPSTASEASMKKRSAIHPSVRWGNPAGWGLSRSVYAMGMLAIAVLVCGCASSARRGIEADRIEAHRTALELHAAHGLPNATIGTDGSVAIGGKAVPIDRNQRAATLAYRHAALDVVDLSLRDASRLMKFAIPRVLFGMVTHGTDDAGNAVEADADDIPHSPQFCSLLQAMLDKQLVMVARVPALGPYARLTSKDIEHCRAGRPYSQPL